jgi:hypothetical protein
MGRALISVIRDQEWKAVEGRRVTVERTDGTSLVNCVVISVGRLWTRTVWLVMGDTDLFRTPEEIADIRVLAHGEAA